MGADVGEGRDPFDFGSNATGGPDWPSPVGPPLSGANTSVHYGPSAGPWNPVAPELGSPPFGGSDSSTTGIVGRAPIGWLIAALVVGAGGVLVSFWGADVAFAMTGWVLSGPTAIGLLAVFTQRDVRQRALPVYIAVPGRTATLYWATVVVAAVGIGLNALSIAQWAGRL